MGRTALTLALLSLILLLNLLCLVKPVSSAEVSEYGDWKYVRVTSAVTPLIDEYGMPMVNPDGSFYPNDAFKLSYIIEVDQMAEPMGVEVSYNKQAFTELDMSEWGKLAGCGSFRVSLGAQPGTYPFIITARARRVISLGKSASSSLTVTYGGAEVNAYYTTWCRLRISASYGGTTIPAPGVYWHRKGEVVTISAIPGANWTVNCWVVDGVTLPGSYSISISMDSPHDVFVDFLYIGPPPEEEEPSENETEIEGVPVSLAAFRAALSPLPAPLINATGAAYAAQAGSAPALLIRNFTWITYFNIFRGVVCQAKGVVCSSDGAPVPGAKITVDFLKKNIFTGAMWISQASAVSDGEGMFVVEDACAPLLEAFLNAVAWAEKPGYLPTWRVRLYVNKPGGEVERGGILVFSAVVEVEGRLSNAPISLYVEGLPNGCSADFSPRSGAVGFFSQFMSIGKIYAGKDAGLGQYAVKVVSLSSSGVRDEAQFTLTVKEFAEKPVLSMVFFRVYGLDSDAYGPILVLDAGTRGEVRLSYSQLPYTAAWNVDSTHTFAWQTPSSMVDGKMYTFDGAEVIMHYVAYSTSYVTVVKYEPHFTLLLAYSVLNSTTDVGSNATGVNSFEKPLAFLIRYDGNGPERNLMQRAIIESFSWEGWLLRGLNETGLQAQAGKLMNLTSILRAGNFYFYAHGLDETTAPEEWVLTVDGVAYYAYNMPAAFSWPPGSSHKYSWNTIVSASDGGFFKLQMVVGSSNESSGTIVVPFYGGAVLAVYVKHRHPLLFLEPWERHERAFLNWTRARLYYANGTLARAYNIYNNNPIPPLLFAGDVRYAVFIFRMDDLVMKRALEQGYSALDLLTRFYSSRFTPSPILVAEFNYTLFHEVFEQLVSVRAVKPAKGGGWEVDGNVFFNITFSPGPAPSGRELYSAWFGNQTDDKVAIKIALEDVYEPLSQWVAGRGETSALLNKTFIHIFRIDAFAEGYGRRVNFTIDRAYVKFREEPYIVFINLAGGGMSVSVLEDTGDSTKMKFIVLQESGGIKSIRIYDDKGRLLLEREYTLIGQTLHGLFGFTGEEELAFRKLPGSGSTITIIAENVWGAETTLTLSVLPYAETPFIILLNQIAFALACLIIAAIIITFILRLLRGR